MEPFETVTGRAYPLGRDNIDTDVILPGRFLKTITRTGLGVAAFETIRAEPGNVFDDPRFAGAPILIAGDNFGCGSSREHAVWALMDLGIRVVVAKSFSDIFAGNAFKNGLLTIALPADGIARLFDRANDRPITVDLAEQRITLDDSEELGFDMDMFRKDCLLRGLDEIGLTLAVGDRISAFEAERARSQPWIGIRA